MIEFSERRVQHGLEFDPARTAVLVVDMLNDFLDPNGAMPLADGHRLYSPIRRLLAVARAHGSPVIWLCDTHPPRDREFDKRTVHCLTGTWGAQIADALEPADDEYRVPKRRYSGFFETDLDLRLRELGIAHVILSGVVTNICVRSTAHDAFFRGYDVIVVEDCVAATGPREQESSLFDIDTHFGTVSSLEEVVVVFDRGNRAEEAQAR
jgi:ureidoacrylate peracid hydrolase